MAFATFSLIKLEVIMTSDDLRKNDMMAHLMAALERGEDIGHYGRLVFVMVGQYFMTDDELVTWLRKDESFSEDESRAMVLEVRTKRYSPPRREKILQFQQHQEFPICPNSDDPDCCNVYKTLTFPKDVYEHITEYYEQKAAAQDAG